eukprot:scaffold1847_cov131-Isochrysis_galbana.AAC.4
MHVLAKRPASAGSPHASSWLLHRRLAAVAARHTAHARLPPRDVRQSSPPARTNEANNGRCRCRLGEVSIGPLTHSHEHDPADRAGRLRSPLLLRQNTEQSWPLEWPSLGDGRLTSCLECRRGRSVQTSGERRASFTGTSHRYGALGCRECGGRGASGVAPSRRTSLLLSTLSQALY